MERSRENKFTSSFTLIELLVVIAILAVLATAVVLVLNPAQLLAQGRDSTRLSDLAALNSALSLFTADQYNQSLGSPNTVYVSIPDNASSTCGSLSLPSLPGGYSYHCVPSASSTKVDGTGWIPVNLTLTSSGSPLSKLPIDPVNTTSSGEYYTYTPGGSYEITAVPESQKYKAQIEGSPMIPMIPGVIAYGSNLSLSPLFNTGGLVGYWPLDEGAGSTANDMSGNGNSGTLNGSPLPAWTTGKVGSGALSFSGGASSSSISVSNFPALNMITFTAWINPNSLGSGTGGDLMSEPCSTRTGYFVQLYPAGSLFAGYQCVSGDSPSVAAGITTNQWQYITVVISGTSVTFYVNGALKGTGTMTTPETNTMQGMQVGGSSSDGYFNGLIVMDRFL